MPKENDDEEIETPEPDDAGGTADDSAGAGAETDGEDEVSAASEEPADKGKKGEPKTMLEAVSKSLAGEAGEGGADPDKDGGRDPDGEDSAVVDDAGGGKKADAGGEAGDPGFDDKDILTVPDGLKPKTKERVEALIGMVSDRDTKLEQAETTIVGFQKILQDSAVESAQEFNELIGFSANLHGTPEQKREALKYLNQQRANLALELGEELEEIDLLADYPDLREAVDSLDMSEKHALELARARSAQQRAGKPPAPQHNGAGDGGGGDNPEAQARERVAVASQAVDKLVKKWETSDPDWKVKEKAIEAQLPDIAQNFPPEQWVQALTVAYKAVVVPKPAAPGEETTLRPGGGRGGQQQPKSMLEAVAAGVNSARS